MILSDKLINLGKNFAVSTIKSKFTYKFAIEDNLFYQGIAPPISYYEDIKKEHYETLKTPYWSFKDETIKYLKNDLCSLFEIVMKANKQVFMDYDADMS